MWTKLKNFLRLDIWRIRRKDLPWHLSYPFRLLRICALAIRGFNQDRCPLRASALTFYTLLSLVPILAMVFGIAKGFGFEDDVRTFILSRARGPLPDFKAAESQIIIEVQSFTKKPVKDLDEAFQQLSAEEAMLQQPPLVSQPGSKEYLKSLREMKARVLSIKQDKSIAETQAEGIDWLSALSTRALSQTKGGVIAGIGVILLFSLVVRLLSNIESTFNDIWGIKKGRRLVRKVSDYLAIIIICPLLLIASNSLAVYIAHKFPEQISHLRMPLLSSIVYFFTSWLPIVVIWIAFTFVYLFMPNTRVRPKVALLAGIAAGTLFQIAQWIYIKFQIGVVHYSAIYGALAAIPLFLVWLQTSWSIMLLGAEISAAADSEESHEFEGDCLNAAQRFRRLLALRVTELCVKNFVAGNSPLTIHALTQRLETPLRLLRETLYELVQANILSEIRNGGGSGDFTYQPAQDVSRITIKRVINALDCYGSQDIPIADDRETRDLSDRLAALDRIIDDSPQNVPLKDL